VTTAIIVIGITEKTATASKGRSLINGGDQSGRAEIDVPGVAKRRRKTGAFGVRRLDLILMHKSLRAAKRRRRDNISAQREALGIEDVMKRRAVSPIHKSRF
jgi:hypothetical protein